MITQRNRQTLWFKMVSMAVVCLFLFNNMAFTVQIEDTRDAFCLVPPSLFIKTIEMFAHRGCFTEDIPPNSLAAFKRAVNLELDGFECDIQLSKDGVPMIMHPGHFESLVDARGNVSDYTLEELKKFRLLKRPGSDEMSGESIPALSEVIELIKPYSMNIQIHREDIAFVDSVVKLIEEHKIGKRVTISSKTETLNDALHILGRVRDLSGEIKTALILSPRSSEIFPRDVETAKELMEMAKHAGVTIFDLSLRDSPEALTREVVDELHNNSIQVCVGFQEADPGMIEEMSYFGADRIICESPDAVTVFRQRETITRQSVFDIYLKKIIGQAIHLGLSERGLKQFIHEQFTHVELANIRWRKITKVGDTVYLPFADKNGNKKVARYYIPEGEDEVSVVIEDIAKVPGNKKTGPSQGSTDKKSRNTPVVTSKAPFLHTGKNHDEFFYWLENMIKEGKLKKGLPLILFDFHHDAFSEPFVSEGTWVYQALEKGYISRVLWVLPSWEKSLPLDIRQSSERRALTEARRKGGPNISFYYTDNIPRVKGDVLVSFDFDFFSLDKEGGFERVHRATENEIHKTADDVFSRLRKKGAEVAVFDLSYSGAPYVFEDQISLIDRVLRQRIERYVKPGTIPAMMCSVDDIAERIAAKTLELVQKKRITSKEISDIIWKLSENEIVRDEHGDFRMFTNEEIFFILETVNAHLVAAGFAPYEQIHYIRLPDPLDQFRGELLEDRRAMSLDLWHLDRLINNLGAFFSAADIKANEFPVFLARDAVTGGEFLKYHGMARGYDLECAAVYQPGMSRKAIVSDYVEDDSTKLVHHAAETAKAHAIERMQRLGKIPAKKSHSFYDTFHPEVYEEMASFFKEEMVRQMEEDPDLMQEAEALFRQMVANGITDNKNIVLMDLSATGKTVLYMKSVLEYFSEREKIDIGKVRVFIGYSHDKKMCLPEVRLFDPDFDARGRPFKDQDWPFYRVSRDVQTGQVTFRPHVKRSHALLHVYRSLRLYNAALREGAILTGVESGRPLRASEAVPEPKDQEGSVSRPEKKIPKPTDKRERQEKGLVDDNKKTGILEWHEVKAKRAMDADHVKEMLYELKAMLGDMNAQLDDDQRLEEEDFADQLIEQYGDAVEYFNKVILNGPMDAEKLENEYKYFHSVLGREGLIHSAGSYGAEEMAHIREVEKLFKNMFAGGNLAVRIKEEPVQAAALVFVTLVNLQPFHDGNKRAASFVMNYILMKSGYTPFILTEDNVVEYARILRPINVENKINRRKFTEFLEDEVRKVYRPDYTVYDDRKKQAPPKTEDKKEEKLLSEKKDSATDFIDRVILRAMVAKQRGEKVVIGIDTSWIPEGQLRLVSGLNGLLNELTRRSKKKGLDNVIIVKGNGTILASDIEAQRNKANSEGFDVPMSNIVILGDEELLKRSEFESFRSHPEPRSRAFFAGVRLPKDFSDKSYIRLLEMLTLAVEHAFGRPAHNEHITVEAFRPDGSKPAVPRYIILIPEATSFDYNVLNNIYNGQRKVVSSA